MTADQQNGTQSAVTPTPEQSPAPLASILGKPTVKAVPHATKCLQRYKWQVYHNDTQNMMKTEHMPSPYNTHTLVCAVSNTER